MSSSSQRGRWCTAGRRWGRHAKVPAAVRSGRRRREARVDEQDWVQVVAAATRAPSIHNTQPWRFTASAERLEVFLDPDRALPVLDPSARQQVISCGCAIEFAVVAATATGVATEVELLPDADPHHLATIRTTGPAPASDEHRALAEAIDRRHTVRAASSLARYRPSSSTACRPRPERSAPGSSRSPAPRRRWRPSS